ncbi:MAG: CBS domain-containing protein [Gammaproteobacteria bacterium]|nr:CBS domain-containing protein [Gammaproteobacteria bacterium]
MSDDKPPSSNGLGKPGWLRRIARRLGSLPRDREELTHILGELGESRILDVQELAMIRGVLEVSESQVRDIMIPRSQMVVLERSDEPQKMLDVINASGHSRFPVIGDDRDEVVGVLLAKDLLRFFSENEESQFDIRECLRPAVFIPESKRLNAMLRDFRVSHNHMAIVVDEYGGVSGLLTIEDVLEEIVGEIGDEHDIEEDREIVREGPRSFLVKGFTKIWDFNDYFGSSFDDEEFDTVAGMIMHELGRLPRRGEVLRLNDIEFRVTRTDRRRVDSVQVTLPEDKPAPVGEPV